MIKFLLAILLTLAPCFGQGMILNPYRFSAASGTLTLDTITTPAFAAYSVSRKLRSAYAGSAFRIRLASDGSEFDIGFDGSGNLNKTYLESTAAGTDAFIKIIYDQSGNGRDITQTTTTSQPKIVSAGTCLLGSNSRPAATFDGTDDNLLVSGLSLSMPVTYFFVINNLSTVVDDNILSAGFNTWFAVRQGIGDHIVINNGAALTASSTYTIGSWNIYKTAFTASGGAIRKDNGSETTGAVGTNTGTYLCLGGPIAYPNFKFSEWIVYNAAIGTTDETTVRDNINSFYTLF